MNRSIERAIFRRVYDGMSGRNDVPRDLVAETVWMARARLAERSEAALIEALTRLISIAALNIYPKPDKPNSDWAILVQARAAIASATGETV